MKTLAVIPARYASTRFPGKPLALIQGKPMIQRVYEQVLKSNMVAAAIVATDDERIASAVENFGGTVVMTQENHPSGTARCFEVWQQSNAGFTHLVNIQGDEPFIHPESIDTLISLLEDPNAAIATLAKINSNSQDFNNANIVKVVRDVNDFALYFSRANIPFSRNENRETRFLQHVGIYGFSRAGITAINESKTSILEELEQLEQLNWLENGLKIKVGLTEHHARGVDVPEDIHQL